MFGTLKNNTKRLLSFTGHYHRRLLHDTLPGVAVLCYHGLRQDNWSKGMMAFEQLHVKIREFEEHCRVISKSCHPISLDDWRAALAGVKALPDRAVLVTFDDGYRSVYTIAKPVLERYQIPAVVFACTDPIVQGSLNWYDSIAIKRGEDEVKRLKTVSFSELKHDIESDMTVADVADPHALLSISELKALSEVPGIEIGGHTSSHLILAKATVQEQFDQIDSNKKMLEAWINRPVTAFSYPNGQPGTDYTDETIELVRKCGYEFAFSMLDGFALSGESLYEISRFCMLAGISGSELAHRLSYSWHR